jgi:ribosomal protein S18 acetylase RimI-like enzyme
MTSDIHLRPATEADAAALSAFGARTFHETFGPQNRPEDIAAYLASAFSPGLQAGEIADPDGHVILAVAPDGDLAGYAHATSGDDGMMLKRLYVDTPYKGRGLAGRLLDGVIAEARRRGASRLWLTVWTENPRAIAFYAKAGFRVCGSTTFVVGDDPQTDHLMELLLPA